MASTYLQIARQVLFTQGTPLSARDILDIAYATRLVPASLFGQTQSKTLQARLSEEIRRNGDQSPFVRTEPGMFFLRELIPNDEAVLRETIFSARPRVLDLNAGRMLTIRKEFIRGGSHPLVPMATLLDDLRRHGRFLSQREFEADKRVVKVKTFVLVARGDYLLTYRLGKYRSHGNSIGLGRSIGFGSPVRERDHDLLDANQMGILNSGLHEIASVLGMSPYIVRLTMRDGLIQPHSFLHHFDDQYLETLHAILVFRCPDRFEPTRKRLAINELRWAHVQDSPNDLDDVEPVSRALLESRAVRDIVANAQPNTGRPS